MQDVAFVGKQDEHLPVHRVDSYGFCQPMKLRVKCDGARDGGRTTNVIKHLHCACVICARLHKLLRANHYLLALFYTVDSDS